MSSITKTGVENLSLTFEYNSAGNRINKTYSAGKTFNYVYDGINVLKEESSTYNAPAYYLSGGIDQLFSRTINNNAEFYLKDAINSLRMVIDNTQGITQSIDYKPFGGVLSGDAGNHHYLYTGREKDFGDTYYYRNRTYSPISGTFQQKDPIGILGGLNLYSYVKNNPVNYVDPLGQAWISVHASDRGDGSGSIKGESGHGWVEVTMDDGTNYQVGNYPNELGNDSQRPSDSTYSWEVKQSDLGGVLDIISGKLLNHSYNVPADNCIDFVESILNAAGIPHQKFNTLGISDPSELVDWLNELNRLDHLKP